MPKMKALVKKYEKPGLWLEEVPVPEPAAGPDAAGNPWWPRYPLRIDPPARPPPGETRPWLDP